MSEPSRLVRLSFDVIVSAAMIAEAVKKHEWYGHGLNREQLRRLVAVVVVNCEQITEAIDDSPKP